MPTISNQIFKDRILSIENVNNLLVTDCIFTGRPLDLNNVLAEAFIMARDYKNLTIRNCKFPNITGDGISLRSTGGSDNTRIENNTFYKITGNGIIAKVGNTNVSIRGNKFFNVGQDAGGKRHCIYAISPDISITNNLMVGTFGDGVSIRSSGEVIGNRIYNPGKSGVRYFPDSAPGPSDILYIEDNECYMLGNGYAAIELLRSSVGKMVASYRISGNRVIGEAMAFQASPEFEGRYEYIPFA